MTNEEKSLFDEIWAAAGMTMPEKPEEPAKAEAPAKIIEEPAKAKPIEEIAAPIEEIEQPEEPAKAKAPAKIIEEPAKAEPIEEIEQPEEPAEEPEEPAEEPEQPEEPEKNHTEKKKSVKFLIIYTIVFVVVITALIGGSYIITRRIHEENNEPIGDHHLSTLQNIKDKNTALQKENGTLKEENDFLSSSQKDTEELLDGAADMVEHQEYLSAAMAEYIDGNRAEARALLSTIDRKKLSPTAKEYYDLLEEKLE